MSKHTPGPWERLPSYGGGQDASWQAIGPRDGRSGSYKLDENDEPVLSPHYRQIASCRISHGTDGAEGKANARLIAAAPELLEALEELVDLVKATREGEYEIDSFTWQPAQAAIAKARGES